MMGLFAATRALHFFSLALLFGGALFETMARKTIPGLEPAPLPWRRAAILALLTALAWLGLAAGQMSGDWTRALNPHTVITVLTDTRFGAVFMGRAFLLLALLVAAFSGRVRWLAVLAGAALAAISLTSHAAASSPLHFAFVGATNDAIHLLTAAFWIGGLAWLLALFSGTRNLLLPALALFSDRGLIAVLLLVMTGIINALTILLSGPGHPSMVYVTLLCIKIALAAGMIGLAIVNRVRLMPRLRAGGDSQSLRASILMELGLGIAILVLVGVLGLTAPLS
jgi:putative copper resistance protein D